MARFLAALSSSIAVLALGAVILPAKPWQSDQAVVAEADPGIDPMITAAVPSALGRVQASAGKGDDAADLGLFLLSRDDDGNVCVFERAPAARAQILPVIIGEDCAELFAPLGRAAHWQDDAKGAVRLSDASGRTLVLFAPGETGEFFSVEPAAVQLTLTPL